MMISCSASLRFCVVGRVGVRFARNPPGRGEGEGDGEGEAPARATTPPGAKGPASTVPTSAKKRTVRAATKDVAARMVGGRVVVVVVTVKARGRTRTKREAPGEVVRRK